jgi:hypothetical protein
MKGFLPLLLLLLLLDAVAAAPAFSYQPQHSATLTGWLPVSTPHAETEPRVLVDLIETEGGAGFFRYDVLE